MIYFLGMLAFVALIIFGGYYLGRLVCRMEAKRTGAEVDCSDTSKWASFLLGKLVSKLIPEHIFEQFALRVYDDDCKTCLNAGKCTTCGCDAYAKMMVPWEKDSRGNWAPVIWNKEEYRKKREQFPVEIKIDYPQIKNQ